MKTIIQYLQDSIRNNWELLALTDFNGPSYQYRDIARKVSKLHLAFESAGIKKGEKIALCGRNSAQWAVAFIATITYGAVAVPILHEFKSDNIHHLVTHSEARLLFTDDAIWENLDPGAMEKLEGVWRLSDFSLIMSRNKYLTEARNNLNEMFGKRYPERFTPDDVVYTNRNIDDIAVINYTSGSTGFSKGVMLTIRNLTSNLRFAVDNLNFFQPGDSLVCMLPLAHMYGLLVELLHPLAKGCHVYFLTRVPSPRVILEAFATVKPKLIVTVPLIIEKIVKTKVFPMLEKPLMKVLMRVPLVDDKLLAKIKAGLLEAFGGNVEEIIIGGAGLNKDVEDFLRRIQFPYTVGYGMTECGPLIAYAPWQDARAQACGRPVDRMECRIDSPDPEHVPGELWVKGDNVMAGYFKNDDATNSVMRDGWMNTGDLCTMDSDGFIYIRGRNKNMILGPSGQNIYPEEIEQKINNLPFVSESLVIDDHGSLVALVYPDLEAAAKEGIDDKGIEKLMNDNINALNKELPAYSQIKRVKVNYQEFEKTPKRSIKRYLYIPAK
ncbi:MAG: AMP-binding protein [Muribaculum sp.]|nr:AMP-binding protein [Muribaculaceae bacterium]MCM1081278.1 AMP-binding protein [Muribaculum sp.]